MHCGLLSRNAVVVDTFLLSASRWDVNLTAAFDGHLQRRALKQQG